MGGQYLGEFMSVNCSCEIPTAAISENMTQNRPVSSMRQDLLVHEALAQARGCLIRE